MVDSWRSNEALFSSFILIDNRDDEATNYMHMGVWDSRHQQWVKKREASTCRGIVCHSDVSSVLTTMWRRQPQAPPQRRFASLGSLDWQTTILLLLCRQRLSPVGQPRRDDGDETFTYTLHSDRWKWAHNYKEMDWRRPEMVANRTLRDLKSTKTQIEQHV